MSIDGDITHVQRNLVKTVDKALLVQMLKEWREESGSKDESTLITDILSVVMAGELDG